MMDNNIVSRLKLFMDHHSLNSLALANALGYKSSEKISRLFRSDTAKPSYDIIYDISSKFDINPDWLITGRGEMFVEGESVEGRDNVSEPLYPVPTKPKNATDNSIIYNMYKEEREKVEAQAEQIGALKQTIKQLEEKIEGLKTDASRATEVAHDVSIADAV